MPNVLRLRRSNPPEPNRNSEAIYAASDGTLKQVAPDGSETDLGSGGGGGSQTLEQVLTTGTDGGGIGMDNTGSIGTGGAGITTAGGTIETEGGNIEQDAGGLTQDDGSDNVTSLAAGLLDLGGPSSFATLDGASGRLSVKPAASGVALTVNGGLVPNGVIDPNGVALVSADSRGSVPAVGAVTVQDLIDVLAVLGLIAQTPGNTVPPVLSGTPQDGETLTTDDGEWTGTEPLTFVYGWRQSPNGSTGWVAITGETANTLILGPSLVGQYIESLVTALNVGGQDNELSNVVGPVIAA